MVFGALPHPIDAGLLECACQATLAQGVQRVATKKRPEVASELRRFLTGCGLGRPRLRIASGQTI
jgi:hypothetical protein